MRLRHKTLLSICAIFVALIAVTYLITSTTLLRDYDRLEERLVGVNLGRVLNSLAAESEQLSTKLADWAGWDDTVSFMKDEDDSYADENLIPEAYESLGLSIVCYLAPDGAPKFAAAYDLAGKSPRPLPEDFFEVIGDIGSRTQNAFAGPTDDVNGLIMLAEGPTLIAARPIHTSRLDGPQEGTLIFARFLDSKATKRITDIVQVRITVSPLDDAGVSDTRPHIEPLSERSISASSAVPDIFGAPIFRVGITMPRDIHTRGVQTASLLLLVLVASGAACAAVVMAVLGRVVLRRIHVLSDDVTAIRAGADPDLRVHAQGRDELAALARSTNDMLDSLSAARHAVEAATRAKSEFLANMSHEIRTPMTAILGFADLLLDADQTASQRSDCVQTIRRNGEHLLTVINDILDLSKIEAGMMSVERVAVDPMVIVRDCTSLLAHRAQGKGLTLRVQAEGRVPATITADPVRLRQIVLNLLGNAIKFTESGEILICVESKTQNGPQAPPAPPAPPALVISVTDHGIGMTEAQVRGLFRPFTQADASTTRRFGGTGLGLTISKTLAQMMGGDIAVQSTLGTGSTFSLSINPGEVSFERAEPPVSATAVESATGMSPDAPPSPPLRVLLAEDGPDNQRLLTHVLKKAGCVVEVVDNGRDAVMRALESGQPSDAPHPENAPFDIILMDMQMPVQDGYSAARELRSRGYEGPIIALTAHAMTGDREACIAAGCDDYLTKPIDRSKLIAAVRRAA